MVKTVPIPCTKEEIDKILEVSSSNDFYYTLFFIAKTTGRRLGEYYNVKVKDIDFDNKTMSTEVLKRRKQVKKEAILSDEASRILKRWIVSEKLKDDDYVFRKRSYRSIQKAITEAGKVAQVPHKVSFHNFRHYFITELIRQGWSYDKVAKLTGHSTVGTIGFYDHIQSTDIKEQALEALKKI